MCTLSITHSMSSVTNPLLHSKEVLQTNKAHIKTITVKKGHELEHNKRSMVIFRSKREIVKIIYLQYQKNYG